MVAALIVEYRKWPARMHYCTTMTLLGTDSAGLWAGSRRGAAVSRGDGATGTFPTDAVTLFPPDRAWSARWYAQPTASGRPARFRFYLDITTRPTLNDTHISLVDLDLDLALTWNDDVVLLDEEEFAHHRTAFNYPDPLVRQALDTFDEMRTALIQRAFPLDGTADPYLTAWFSNQDPGDTPQPKC